MRYRLLLLLILLLPARPLLAATDQPSPTVRSLTVQASINPVTAGFIVEQIALANERQELAILLQLDTPGGLDSAMRMIIQAELQSQRPVIVYVAPSGARAASAGALITLAADFAVMAPGTNIGAAHPVSLGIGLGADDAQQTMQKKIENDAIAYIRSLAAQRGRNADWAEQAVRDSLSTAAAEALELGVIDLLAASPSLLLSALDGRHYQRNGQDLVLHSAGATLVAVDMNWRQQILNALSDPTVAYLLLLLGLAGIFFEISQPGVILPGAIGAIALLLALFALQTLPVNYVGVLLILLALILFILEVKVMSYGMLTIGGIIAMAAGSLMLIDSSAPYLQISRAVIAAAVLVSSGFFIFAMGMVLRTQRRPAVSGAEGMVGEIGRAVGPIDGSGKVFVHGEYWDAVSDEAVEADAAIEVLGIGERLQLSVRPYRGKDPH